MSFKNFLVLSLIVGIIGTLLYSWVLGVALFLMLIMTYKIGELLK